MLLVLVMSLKLVAEIALLAMLGQWLVGLLAGDRRESNLFYKLFQVLTSPFVRGMASCPNVHQSAACGGRSGSVCWPCGWRRLRARSACACKAALILAIEPFVLCRHRGLLLCSSFLKPCSAANVPRQDKSANA